MATEAARCACKPGRTPNDPASEGGQALKDCFNTLIEQDGFQRLYWGLEVENPDVCRLFIDWDSVDAHKKFMNSPQYKPFTDRLGFIWDFSQLQMIHVHMSPHPPSNVLSDMHAPVTEIITAYYPASYSKADQDTLADGMRQLTEAIKANDKTYRGFAGGWAEEEQDIPEKNGEKGKVYIGLIAWDSVEAHLNFRKTQAFKDNIHHLRGSKDLQHIHVVHCSHLEVTKGGGVSQ